MHRRDFLAASVATLAAAGMWPQATAAGASHGWVGARLDAEGRPRALRFDADGTLHFDIALPARMHGAAYSPVRSEIVLVSRRPGDYLLVVDARSGAPRHRVAAAPERFFNGHAVFARGLLFATETVVADDPPSGNGLLGVYDPQAGYARIGEFATGGHDPHQLLALGDTLAVANGGLLTHPDAPGVVLNPDSMDSSLALIDAREGRIKALHRLAPEFSRLGLRHMALGHDGTLAVGMQYEGARADDVPLVALLRPGRALEPLELAMQSRLANYVGSVAFDGSGRILGLSSPRGGVALFHDLHTGRPVGLVEVPDGCALGADGARRFVVGSGLGGTRRVVDGRPSGAVGDVRLAGARWDNHFVDLPA
ncbi:MAG: DUF1513 domain-containing protein [Zoogloeaceae bacterium]|nr:DUF1513 domain-containing protein [Zoogloeaceae bacterium]